jgi:hypothetical protein
VGVYDIELVVGERYDRIFRWKQAPGGARLPMTGMTAVMIICSSDISALWSSDDVTPLILLDQEPAGAVGDLHLTIDKQLAADLLHPYLALGGYSYRIDLMDNSMVENAIPFMYGSVTSTSRDKR